MQEIQPACTKEDETCDGRGKRGYLLIAECGFELLEVEVGSSNRDILGLRQLRQICAIVPMGSGFSGESPASSFDTHLGW